MVGSVDIQPYNTDIASGREKVVTQFNGFTLEQTGPLNPQRTLLVTLPGLGDVAKQNYLAITNTVPSAEKPTGLLVSYTQGFDRETFLTGFIGHLEALADSQPIHLVIHACSFSASLLPDLLERLRDHSNIKISGVMLRAPLFAHEYFSLKLRRAKLDVLARMFRQGLKGLQATGEVPENERAASERELLDTLPAQLTETFLTVLKTDSISFFVILLDNDHVLDNKALVELLEGQVSVQTLPSDEKYRMGHYPADPEVLQELVTKEHMELEHMFTAHPQDDTT